MTLQLLLTNHLHPITTQTQLTPFPEYSYVDLLPLKAAIIV